IKVAEFAGKREKTLTIVVPAGTKLSRVVLVGLGDVKSLDANACERMGAVAYDAVANDPQATILLEALAQAPEGDAGVAAYVAGGALLKSYRFGKYRTKEDKD